MQSRPVGSSLPIGSMLLAHLALIATGASFLMLAGCAAHDRARPRYVEVETTTPGQLPPPSAWLEDSAPAIPTARAEAHVYDTNLPSVEWQPQPTSQPQVQAQAQMPPSPVPTETAVVRLYPPRGNGNDVAARAATGATTPGATASGPTAFAATTPGVVAPGAPTTNGALATTTPPTPMPRTTTADAFSADASLFNDTRPKATTTGQGVAAYAPNTPVTNGAQATDASQTGSAVRAAAAAGARAFTDADSPTETKPVGEPFAVAYEQRGIILTLGDDLFLPKQAAFAPGANLRLDEVAKFLMSYPGRSIIVESHTDSGGTGPENLQLSQNRAEIVRAALLARGVSPGSISARGYGESYPRASNIAAQGRAENRRTEIVLLPPGQTGPRYREMFEASAGDLLQNEPGEAPGSNALDLGADATN